MTVTSTAQDILEAVAKCVAGGTAPTGTGAPAAWREWGGPSLAPAKDRHYAVKPTSILDLTDDGVDTQTAYVDRVMEFEIWLKWVMEAKTPIRSGMAGALQDVCSIVDRVQRQLREHNTAFEYRNGVAAPGSLAGLATLDSRGPATFVEGEDASIIYAIMPFVAHFTDTQVVS